MRTAIKSNESVLRPATLSHWSRLQTVTSLASVPVLAPLRGRKVQKHAPMPNARLQQAYESLMQRAPSPLFKKARALYLCKYPLDGRDCNGSLRLFVSQESIEERIVPAPDEGERLAVLSIHPVKLALVHWGKPDPAPEQEAATYFEQQWDLVLPALQPQDQAWFRDGGHQSLFTAPKGLHWLRSSPMPKEQSSEEG
tara:strand:+ start:475 stop:1065 length:591 start_codon:yes stop_codon:yes gene_type:complete